MSRKLWCITDGISLVDIFMSKSDAEFELDELQETIEEPILYDISMEELDDYPEECDLAIEKGYI